MTNIQVISLKLIKGFYRELVPAITIKQVHSSRLLTIRKNQISSLESSWSSCRRHDVENNANNSLHEELASRANSVPTCGLAHSPFPSDLSSMSVYLPLLQLHANSAYQNQTNYEFQTCIRFERDTNKL